MSLTAFPEPTDLEVPFNDRIGDSKPKSFQQYDVSNPHPGYGKDPNILNEFGHTKFPMWADAQTIVNNEEELAEFNAKKNPASTPWPTAK